jgi:hypothetical protein
MADDLPIAECGELDPSVMYDQRWWRGHSSWRPRSMGGFNSSLYSVEPIDVRTARSYVVENHYSGSYPADSKRFGLFVNDPDEGSALVGVAVFGIPAQMSVLSLAFPGLEPVTQALELSRLVLEGAPAAGLRTSRPSSSAGWERAPANAERGTQFRRPGPSHRQWRNRLRRPLGYAGW